MEAANSQGPADQERLVRHVGALHAYVRLRLGGALRSREESLDIAQSVVREALQDLGRFEGNDAQMRAWVLKRAENKIRDRARYWARDRRAAHREGASADDDPAVLDAVASLLTPSRVAAGREQLARLEDAFAKLDEDQRRVILLVRVAGLAHAEVAAEMGRSEMATRTLLSRSLARLSVLLEEKSE